MESQCSQPRVTFPNTPPERRLPEDLAAPPFSEEEYYSRQTRLPEVGASGQAKLRAGRVLVVGAGGLGSPALSYLAAAGVGTLGICESDRLEASNLHRQTLFHYVDVGKPKAELAARRVREQNPFVDVRIHESGLTPENALDLFAQYDLVLDCTDNFATKYLINDTAVLARKPAVIASIYQYEGQLLCVNAALGGPCLRCLWPDLPEPDCVGSCADVGVLGAVPGVLGTMQAVEALKIFLGLGEPLHDAMVIMDCLSYTTQRVRMTKHPLCPICGEQPRITGIVREEYLPPQDIDVDVQAWPAERLQQYRIIDIREEEEVAYAPLEGVAHEHIAMSTWDPGAPPVAREEASLLVCARGMRSLHLAERLRKMGYERVYSVRHGVGALKR